MQEIGRQPVPSFGNSTGDSSMAEFVTSGNPYRSLAFMLCCDDTERENGSRSKADKTAALCEEFGWVPISMENDWRNIYGEGVTYLGGGVREEMEPTALSTLPLAERREMHYNASKKKRRNGMPPGKERRIRNV